MGIVPKDFAGTENGKFFQFVPDFVDRKQKPGFSPMPPPTAWSWVVNAITLHHIWGSPNFVWAAIALLCYFFAPYDLSKGSVAAKAPVSLEFFLERFPFWLVVTQGYNLFWHVTLFVLGWAKRPFLPNRKYNLDKVMHNVFWSTCGVAIFVPFENVFCFLWSTGRLAYMPDAEAFSTPLGLLKFFAGLAMVPLWREAHFYFAHRMLHFKPIYSMVHSLHHRNQDIEPFAGLSMHPVEHLYYFSCVMPSLLPCLSPFHFLWNGVHLLISPAASHSGWEDHFQSDIFHYLHHRYFECNYAGSGAGALDVFFGSFVGAFTEKDREKLIEFGDAKSSLKTIIAPPMEFVAYLFLASACVFIWAYAACVPGALAAIQATLPFVQPIHLALLAGVGPVIAALPFSWTGGTSPFDSKAAPLFHLTGSTIVCVAPIVIMAYMSF